MKDNKKIGNWISVKEKLPDGFRYQRLWLTVRYPNGARVVVEGCYDAYCGEFRYPNQRPIKKLDVTAWKKYYMPEPYREEDGG